MSTLLETSRVRLRPLVIRPEDGEYVVGSLDNGEFVAIPEVGKRAIELLGDGRTLEEASRQLGREYDAEVPLADFVEQLCELGFVASIDGSPVEGGEPAFRPNFPRLRQHHVQWLFRPWLAAPYVAVLAWAAVAVARRPGPGWLRYDTLLWSDSVSLVLVANFALVAALAALHEFAHLAAARSLGLPARFGLSTRLGTLAPVTDVRCLWAVEPRRRYRVYLAGMASDLMVISAAQLTGAYLPGVRAPMDALSLLAVLAMLGQLQLYMRTDLYLVATTLARTKNLHNDAVVYLLDRLRRLRDRRHRPDPLAELSARETLVVRRYAIVMVAGSAVALTLLLTTLGTNLVAAIARAITAIGSGAWLRVLDGAATLTILLLFQTLFVLTLLRLRGERLRRLRQRFADGPADHPTQEGNSQT